MKQIKNNPDTYTSRAMIANQKCFQESCFIISATLKKPGRRKPDYIDEDWYLVKSKVKSRAKTNSQRLSR